MQPARSGIFLLALGLFWGGPAVAQDFEKPPINYGVAGPRNPVARLGTLLESGKLSLGHEKSFGYLRSLLQELDIPVSSQTLVFSKTSLQRHRISPETPRALYFNDDIYIGYCHLGDVLEISVADERLGTAFYTLDQRPSEKPEFVRQSDNCLTCHGSSNTLGVPGHLVRSVFPNDDGLPIFSSGTFRIDHTSPYERRRGGWYVTGTHGEETHLGNVVFTEDNAREPVQSPEGLNLTTLSRRVQADAYLSPHSDVVALMVLEHQVQAHNLLTKASFEARMALHYEAQLNRELGEPSSKRWNSTTVRIRSAGEALVKYLLFCNEPELNGPVTGTSDFAAEFSARGRKDSRGRSLRDFDLERRMFKYPCSYLIHSRAFETLPADMKSYVHDRLWAILTGEDASPDFAHLTPDDRRAILEILRDTMANLPDSWKAPSDRGNEVPAVSSSERPSPTARSQGNN